MNFTGAAAIAGVMGWPVGHSRSPAIHNYWLRKFGIDGVYIPFAVRPERTREAIHALPSLGIRGTNVTLPHKEAAFESVDETDSVAARVKAVNTVTVREDGSLYGQNTDAFGFLEALKESCPGWRGDDGPAVILGAGGAARALAAGLQDAGVPDIRVANRTSARAQALAGEFGPPVRAVRWTEREDALAGSALLVNATSLGMRGKDDLEVRLDALPAAAVVCDIVYTPLRTGLLRNAESRGNRTVDGLGMLLHQARPGFAAWFGRDPSPDQALRDLLATGLKTEPS